MFLNKRDLPDALPESELEEALGVAASCEASGRKFFVQPAIATTGDGLQEGVAWLCDNMAEL